jgi:hypothetical protein
MGKFLWETVKKDIKQTGFVDILVSGKITYVVEFLKKKLL